ncbi:MAG: trypsin-like peptidase domain-containing protein [Bacteroidota bacterium]|nr:trypsin-like peptidase domain-containing protein [Bacteroidota bacterium]
MKIRNAVLYILFAVVGGFVALFAYVKFVDNPGMLVEQKIQNDSQFTNFVNRPVTESMPVNFVNVAEQTVKGVVHVKTVSETEANYNPIYEFFYGSRSRSRTVLAFGSGVILSQDGYIVTNNHVIEGAENIEVILDDKRTFEAKLIGLDPNTDIALLKVNAKGLSPVPFGNSDEVRLGQWVLAVGNPFNLTSTVTAGIISAKGRSIGILGGNYKIESFLQTDAALNHGNSGGALVNTDGELIGITSAIVSATGEYSGNSFAIPVEIVKKVVADLKEYGRVQRAILGVSINDVNAKLVKDKNLDSIEGVYINSVSEGGAAFDAGIKEGDIVLSIDRVNVNSVAELQERFSRYRPGDRVPIVIKRKGKSKQYDVVLRNLEGGTEIVRSSDYMLGGKFIPITQKEKKEFKLSNGLKLTSLRDGRLSKMGLKPGYIIVRINNNKMNDVVDISRIEDSGEEIYSIEGVTPEGMQFSYRFH